MDCWMKFKIKEELMELKRSGSDPRLIEILNTILDALPTLNDNREE